MFPHFGRDFHSTFSVLREWSIPTFSVMLKDRAILSKPSTLLNIWGLKPNQPKKTPQFWTTKNWHLLSRFFIFPIGYIFFQGWGIYWDYQQIPKTPFNYMVIYMIFPWYIHMHPQYCIPKKHNFHSVISHIFHYTPMCAYIYIELSQYDILLFSYFLRNCICMIFQCILFPHIYI